jgi:hypothetical protein
MLTQEKLKTVVTYDELTGKFYWNCPSKFHAKGDLAGSIVKGKYPRVKLWLIDRQYSAERVAFLYMTGKWPLGVADHINHDTLDNRFSNLRDVTNQQNQFNQVAPHKGSTNKYLGVSFFKRTGKYQARIAINKKQTHLGYYETPELAWEAYKIAKAKYHGIVL